MLMPGTAASRAQVTWQRICKGCWACLKQQCAVQVALGPGVVVSIKFKAVSELLPNGMKEGAACLSCLISSSGSLHEVP